jgi:hypothetical protein
MHLIIEGPAANSVDTLIICPIKVVDRLKTTCFRGRDLKLAGNFRLWESVEEVMRGQVRNDLVDDALELWQIGDFGTHSLRLEMSIEVGWESTAPKNDFHIDELEWFEPNKHSCAKRVRLNRIKRLAPLSRDLTIVYQLEDQRGEPKVTIWSMYPGVDIGELDGDITKRESRVFFDWNHRGE